MLLVLNQSYAILSIGRWGISHLDSSQVCVFAASCLAGEIVVKASAELPICVCSYE